MTAPATNEERVFTVEQAEALAKRIDVSEDTVLVALGLKDAFSPKERAQIKACDTFTKALKMYNDAPLDSEFERLALTKCLELVTTLEQAEELWEKVPEGSEFGYWALAKITELSSAVLAQTTSFETAKDIYFGAPQGSQLERLAIRRMAELL